MQRDETEAAAGCLGSECRAVCKLRDNIVCQPRPGQIVIQSVYHNIADEVHSLGGDTFSYKPAKGGTLSREKKIRKLISYEPIGLLRHCAVVGAQAGLHVGQWNQQLGRNKSRR